MKINRGFCSKKCDPAGADGGNLSVGAVTETPVAAAPVAEPATAPEAAPAPAQVAPSAEDLSVEQIMAFDPFADNDDGFNPATPAPPEGPAGEPGIVEPVVPVSGTPEVPAAAPNAVDGNVEQLKGQVQQLTQMLTMMQQQQGNQNPAGNPAPGTPAAADSAADDDGEPDYAKLYNFNIPPELLTLFNSEEPGDQQQAFAAYGMGIAKSVHSQVMAQMNTQMESIPTVMRQTMDAQNYYKGIFDDFYGNNADLNRPEIHNIVSQVAKQVMVAEPGKAWTPELRDKIANQVRTTIASIAGQPAQPAAPAAVPVVPAVPAQPYQAAPGARPVVEAPNNITADIAATLF